jgi:hypothetical protein
LCGANAGLNVTGFDGQEMLQIIADLVLNPFSLYRKVPIASRFSIAAATLSSSLPSPDPSPSVQPDGSSQPSAD